MIGQRIKNYRLSKKLSLSELAERAGVAKSYLSNMERDIQTNPSIQFLEKIADALDVTVDDLLNPIQKPESSEVDPDMDPQWYELVREAMNSGISKEQFKEFLEFTQWKMNNK
ncbi:transcriptional regulator [Paenibacillus swuensis]|uniref:Transcriptional regulator n=1 Tax=Paenibacillus swuensis TaxID=1178515 RepID=A0A172TGU8_9BACL|nr:helix-turn-helix domain-containing protein [Paenibacillus swuensis]ANE46265.1 transcriptional regulator [Paenibacillus swuensis]